MYKILCATLTVSGTIVGVIGREYYKIAHSDKKLTLVMDLDNTLIHAKQVKPYVIYKNQPSPRYTVDVDGEVYNVWVRPFALPVLWLLSKCTNLYLYTSATRDYTDTILRVTNWKQFFLADVTRDEIDTDSGKDMTKITQMSDPILIDDKLYNSIKHQQFYHIPAYKYYMRDREMLLLAVFVLINTRISDRRDKTE